MAFDPNTYLAEKTAALQKAAQAPSQGFDPDTYLAQKQAALAQAANPQRMPAADLAKPGMLESLGRGAEQGATMGFGDELNGALSAIAQKAGEHSDENLTDLYTKNRDESRAAMKAAENAHPFVYGAGNVAGGLGTALATAGGSLAEEGALGAIKAGGAIGAVSGLGNSEKTTLPGMASDALAGGAAGAVTGLIGQQLLSKIAAPVANAISDVGPIPSITGSFKQGVGGRKLFGASGAKAVNDEFGTTLDNATGTVQNALNTASANKQAALNGAESPVDITNWVGGVVNGLKNAKANNPFGSDHADLDKVLNVVGDFVNGNEDSGIAGKGLQVSARDLEMLKRKIGDMGTEGDSPLNTSVGKQFVNRIMNDIGDRDPNLIEQSFNLPDDFTPLKETLNNHIEGLDETNQRIHQLKTALDMMPNKSTVAGATNTTPSGFNASDKMQDFLGALPEDIRSQIAPQLNDIGKAASISGKLQTGGLAPGLLSQSASGEPYALANAAGLVAGKVGRVVKGVVAAVKPTAASTLRDMAPEELGSLASKLKVSGSDVGTKLGSVLEQASQKDQSGRNALLFTIEQNPMYRDAISKVTGQPALPNQ
jgi:hypothetical protein